MPKDPLQPVVMLTNWRSPAAWIDVVHSGALASLLLYAQELVTTGGIGDEWERWFASGSNRTVLRAGQQTFAALLNTHARDEHVLIETGMATAFALGPRDPLQGKISKLTECKAVYQHRGTDDQSPAQPSTSPLVILDSSRNDLAGQAVRIVAESLTRWFRSCSPDRQSHWYNQGCPFGIIRLDPEPFSQMHTYGAARASAVVQDGSPAVFVLSLHLTR